MSNLRESKISVTFNPESKELLRNGNVMWGRETEMDRFNDSFYRLSIGRPTDYKLFALYGVAGIGKSTVLRTMASEAERKGGSVLLVDFVTDRQREELLEKPQILLKRQVDAMKATNTSGFDAAYKALEESKMPDLGIVRGWSRMERDEQLYNKPDWFQRWINLNNEWVRLLPKVNTSSDVATMFFDNTDSARYELLNFIETWIISPSRNTNSITGFASRRPRRWIVPEIRQGKQEIELEPLANDAMHEIAIRALGDKFDGDMYNKVGIAILINKLSSGNPKIAEMMAEKAKGMEVKKVGERRLIASTYKEYVEDCAMEGVRLPLKYIIGLMSMTEMLSSEQLMYIMKRMDPAAFGDSADLSFFNEMFQEMQISGILVRNKSGIAINPHLKGFMQKYWHSTDPAKYIAVHNAGLEWTQNILQISTEGLRPFMVKEIYHKVALGETSPNQLKRILGRRLKNIVFEHSTMAEFISSLQDDFARHEDLDRLAPGLAEEMIEYLEKKR